MGVGVAEVVLNPLLIGSLSIPDALPQIRPGCTVKLPVTGPKSRIMGLQQMFYIVVHPRLVVRKHTDPFRGGDIFNAAFYIK